jgi:hypothetical protein
METIIGFAAGYLAGTRDGREGLDRIKTSVEAIVKSPETRRLATQAISIAGAVARQAASRGIGGTASGVAAGLVRRVGDAAVAKPRS